MLVRELYVMLLDVTLGIHKDDLIGVGFIKHKDNYYNYENYHIIERSNGDVIVLAVEKLDKISKKSWNTFASIYYFYKREIDNNRILDVFLKTKEQRFNSDRGFNQFRYQRTEPEKLIKKLNK